MPTIFPRRALALAFSALLSAGASAADEAACQYVQIGELPLRYLGDSFHPAVDGSINGKPVTMLFDTGAHATLLTPRAAQRFDLTQRSTGRYSRGIGGETRMYSARIDDFGIGPIHTGKRRLDVIGEMGWNGDFDAIVGADFLFQADMEIALADKAVRFFRPHNCKDSYLAYWGKDAVEVPFTGSFGNSRNQVFTVKLNGIELDAVIDSGAGTSIVFARGARKAGVGPDTPGTVKAGFGVGVGADKAQQWRAVFKTLAIGGELIRDAELVISDDGGDRHSADILLGADFLRAHRVLFAMSQQRLYISYLGGEIFHRGPVAIEPWLQKEADAGNPDAQFFLANKYQAGNGVPRDPAAAAAWLQKAALQGHAGASQQHGVNLFHAGKSTEAAAVFRSLLDKSPELTRAALYLFLAQLQGRDAVAAARDLDARLAAEKEREWPAPVADYYLGRIDAPRLLALAAKDPAMARRYTCEAKLMMYELAGAQRDKEKAKSLVDAWRAECVRAAPGA